MKEKILDNSTKLCKRDRSNSYYVAVKSFTQKTNATDKALTKLSYAKRLL